MPRNRVMVPNSGISYQTVYHGISSASCWVCNSLHTGTSVKLTSFISAGSDYETFGVLPQIGYFTFTEMDDDSVCSRWCVSISIIDDIEVEGDETFTVHLSTSSVEVAALHQYAQVTIEDDEGKWTLSARAISFSGCVTCNTTHWERV